MEFLGLSFGKKKRSTKRRSSKKHSKKHEKHSKKHQKHSKKHQKHSKKHEKHSKKHEKHSKKQEKQSQESNGIGAFDTKTSFEQGKSFYILSFILIVVPIYQVLILQQHLLKLVINWFKRKRRYNVSPFNISQNSFFLFNRH